MFHGQFRLSILIKFELDFITYYVSILNNIHYQKSHSVKSVKGADGIEMNTLLINYLVFGEILK